MLKIRFVHASRTWPLFGAFVVSCFALPSRLRSARRLLGREYARDVDLVGVGRGEGEHLAALIVVRTVGMRGPSQARSPTLASRKQEGSFMSGMGKQKEQVSYICKRGCVKFAEKGVLKSENFEGDIC